MRRRLATRARVTKSMIGAVTFILTVVIGVFIFTAPLTYGTPGLEPAQVHRRRILSTWTLHFAPSN